MIRCLLNEVFTLNLAGFSDWLRQVFPCKHTGNKPSIFGPDSEGAGLLILNAHFYVDSR